MRGQNDDTDRPRPIFSRSSDGRLRAGNGHIAPAAHADAAPAPPPKVPPVLHIPPRPVQTHIKASAPVTKPQPYRQPSSAVTSVPAGAPDPLDVGDMWSEQERIRLQEKWEDEQRKAQRRKRRREALRKTVTGVPAGTSGSATGPAARTEPKEITLNISMPSLSKVALPKVRIPALPRVARKRLVLAGVAAAVLTAGLGGYALYTNRATGPTAQNGTDNGVKIEHLSAAEQTGKPDYETILPYGKTIETYGAWVRVSPPGKNPVYAYADQLNNVLINVSEQPVPASFKSDTEGALADLAKQYSANTTLNAGETTAYIGTSAKGPQSVLLIKEDLLILMKSASKIPDGHWVEYIKSLR